MAQLATIVFLLASLLPATLWAKADGTLAAKETAHLAPPPRKIARYAQRLISRYDTDGSGNLSSEEWGPMQGQPAAIDYDQNGQITSTEMILHIIEYSRTRRLGRSVLSNSDSTEANDHPANGPSYQDTTADKSSDSNIDSATNQTAKHPHSPFHVPANNRLNHLPNWFSQRDLNGDGQLSLAEFSPTRSRELVKAFQKLDVNRDGLVTPQESVRPK